MIRNFFCFGLKQDLPFSSTCLRTTNSVNAWHSGIQLKSILLGQATMERIGGFKAEPLAARREAALIALTLKQLDGDCRELQFCGITLLYW
jgi:hypothetical protein